MKLCTTRVYNLKQDDYLEKHDHSKCEGPPEYKLNVFYPDNIH